MRMEKQQLVSILIAIACLIILYFGFDIVPGEQRNLEKSRAINSEVTSVQNLILEAREKLGAQYGIIEALNMELKAPQEDSIKIERLKTLSGKWYEFGFPAISGFYAQEIAEISGSAYSWSMAGTTFLLAVKDGEEGKTKEWSFARTIQAFENAISLEPDIIDHRINLSLAYIEMPLANNPMKGIMMLRELNEEHPESVKVILQLARLSLVTNQYDNAIKRLKEAENLDSNNKTTICLLAQTYRKLNDVVNADIYDKKCISK